jgi:archaellin
MDGRKGLDNLFDEDAFSSFSLKYGIIVLKDANRSCCQTTSILNSGDSKTLTLNTTAMFNGLTENVNI